MIVDLLVGIDLGTSSVKGVLFAPGKGEIHVVKRDYPLLHPHPWAVEQDPDDWFDAVCEVLGELVSYGEDNDGRIAAIGLSGQMHGTVLTDSDGHHTSNAIIWADQRAASVMDDIDEAMERENVRDILLNRPFPGTQLGTLLWLRKNDSERLEHVHKVLLPKDHLFHRLTGKFMGEHSDASSTLLYDVGKQDWSEELLGLVGLTREHLPPIESSISLANILGEKLPPSLRSLDGVPLIIGGGDQPTAAIGNGVVRPGTSLITLGSGGQVFMPTSTPCPDEKRVLHCFRHAVDNTWFTMGAMLAAGVSIEWFKRAYNQKEMDGSSLLEVGDGPFFLPYILGERSPFFEPELRGTFANVRSTTSGTLLGDAVLEGISFALRHIIEVMDSSGCTLGSFRLGGGGSSNEAWTGHLATTLGSRLHITNTQEPSGVGAALLAGTGIGIYPSVEVAADREVKVIRTIEPQTRGVDERYHRWRDLQGRMVNYHKEGAQ